MENALPMERSKQLSKCIKGHFMYTKKYFAYGMIYDAELTYYDVTSHILYMKSSIYAIYMMLLSCYVLLCGAILAVGLVSICSLIAITGK